jgi:hypothetical protein
VEASQIAQYTDNPGFLHNLISICKVQHGKKKSVVGQVMWSCLHSQCHNVSHVDRLQVVTLANDANTSTTVPGSCAAQNPSTSDNPGKHNQVSIHYYNALTCCALFVWSLSFKT